MAQKCNSVQRIFFRLLIFVYSIFSATASFPEKRVKIIVDDAKNYVILEEFDRIDLEI